MQFHELKADHTPTETRFIFGRKVVVTDGTPGALQSRLYVLSGEPTGDARTDAFSDLIAQTATGEHKTLAGAPTWAKGKTGAA